ncbi:NUDIX hydrolase [Candidatus Micrarchaeota archaeon]|nr:NUDIX hydrolase [Candidatus Micrarchaeota archaeon]
MRRKTATGTPMVKALACGMLEDNDRVLFLKKIEHGIERLELPCVLVPSGKDPVSLLVSAFKEQTGIDAELCDLLFERRHNAGTRRRKNWVPCLVFGFRAKKMSAKPSSGFSGFKWISLENARKQKLGRNTKWLYVRG